MRPLAEIAPGVLVATAELYTTTSTIVVGAGKNCLVVDPAVSAAEVASLASELTGRGLRPQAGWATHAHWDHVLWCQRLGEVPRYATARTAALASLRRTDLIASASAAAPGHDADLVGQLTALPQPRIPWDGPPAHVVEHDAHEAGHGAVFLPDAGALLAGDMLSDIEIPLLAAGEPNPLATYRHGLELLAAVPGVRLVVPGHGHVGDAAEFRRRVAADLRYLAALERGLASAGDDERIGSGWLRAEHERQLAMIRT
jgi:hydroxyacylglutathione hydrolase